MQITVQSNDEEMEYSVIDYEQSEEVIDLFKSVFSDSEGQDEGKLIGNLVSELVTTNGHDVFGFVATQQGKVVGSIFFSRLTFQDDTDAFILSPVAVDAVYQGKGIGQKLINFGIHHIKDRGVELVFTYGDPNFYQKVGFQPVSEENIKAPLKLTQPEGWLGQSLTDDKIKPIAGPSQCVAALNKPELW